MCAIGLMIATYNVKGAYMDKSLEIENNDVDHFLISTRENQFLVIFVDQVAMVKAALNIIEE